MTILRGMTWSHARGLDPLLACSALWRERTGVEITWDQRPLQDFESYPVEELARRYDLIVIDHPHVGQVTREHCLLPLDVPGRDAEREALARGSIGRSYASYDWAGRQWAFPLDAAAQVQAWRPDLIDAPARTWQDVMRLAADGSVLLPLRPPHNLMCLFTLTAGLGQPCREEGPLVDPATGERVYDLLAALLARVDRGCLDWDPIAVFERMAEAGSRVAVVPLVYGYISYARQDFRPYRLSFADIPAVGEHGVAGSALGGTGIAVSARSTHQAEALDFAYWVASGPVQRGPYAQCGGQAGHAEAWSDEAANAPVGHFYRDTRATLDLSWVRPRHDGYMAFQHEGSERLRDGLRRGEAGASVIAALNELYRHNLHDHGG